VCTASSSARLAVLGWRTFGTRAQNGKWHSLLSLFLFLLPDQLLYCEQYQYVCMYICVYIYIYMYTYLLCADCIWIAVATKCHYSETFYTNRSGAKCWLDIYRWGPGLAVPGQIHVRDIGQNVLVFFWNRKQWQPSYCHILLLIAFLQETFIRNTVIILRVNCIIIVWVNNNNNAKINDNCRRPQDFITLFEIPMSTRKNFFEMYRKFGHSPSKTFASTELAFVCSLSNSTKTTWL